MTVQGVAGALLILMVIGLAACGGQDDRPPNEPAKTVDGRGAGAGTLTGNDVDPESTSVATTQPAATTQPTGMAAPPDAEDVDDSDDGLIIGDGIQVTCEYTLRSGDGEVLDTSDGRGPLKFVYGTGAMIPGFERALTGKKAGDHFKFEVPPELGYGMPDPALVQQVPRSQFGDIGDLEPGTELFAQTQRGPIKVVVREVTKDTVVVDMNHRLAGRTLYFEVKILSLGDGAAS